MNEKIIEYCLEKKAKITDESFEVLGYNESLNLEMIKIFLENKADINLNKGEIIKMMISKNNQKKKNVKKNYIDFHFLRYLNEKNANFYNFFNELIKSDFFDCDLLKKIFAEILDEKKFDFHFLMNNDLSFQQQFLTSISQRSSLDLHFFHFFVDKKINFDLLKDRRNNSFLHLLIQHSNNVDIQILKFLIENKGNKFFF